VKRGTGLVGCVDRQTKGVHERNTR
jgi:hypothetical protein